MLVRKCKRGSVIRIGDDIEIHVTEPARIAINAPHHVVTFDAPEPKAVDPRPKRAVGSGA